MKEEDFDMLSNEIESFDDNKLLWRFENSIEYMATKKVMNDLENMMESLVEIEQMRSEILKRMQKLTRLSLLKSS